MHSLSEILSIRDRLCRERQELEQELHSGEHSCRERLFIWSEIIDINKTILLLHLEISSYLPEPGGNEFQ